MHATRVPQQTVPSAAAVVKVCDLTDEANVLLGKEMTAWEFVELLRERGLDADALRVLAHALPKRAAVWWGCLCAWAVNREAPPEKFDAALQAAVRWVLDPSEEQRRAAEKPGQEVGLGDPAGCLAMAAFWSGGSMTPPHLPPVPPPEYITARLVGGAVLLAAVLGDALRQRENYRAFLALGEEVFRGENLWSDSPENIEVPAVRTERVAIPVTAPPKEACCGSARLQTVGAAG